MHINLCCRFNTVLHRFLHVQEDIALKKGENLLEMKKKKKNSRTLFVIVNTFLNLHLNHDCIILYESLWFFRSFWDLRSSGKSACSRKSRVARPRLNAGAARVVVTLLG